MNKQRFNDILGNFHRIGEEDIQQLRILADSYPFSQIMHVLLAKAAFDAGLPDAKQKINKAALYTTDRKVLKDIMESVGRAPWANSVGAEGREAGSNNANTNETSASESTLDDTEADRLRQEVMRNLALLMESKKPYLGQEKKPAQAPTTMGGDKKKPVSNSPKKKKNDTTPSIGKERLSTARPQRNVPIKMPVEPKQKEQIDIIDRFINAEPSLRQKASLDPKTPSNQKDLSEHSGAFGEDLVSETLAKILAKQGKTAKALDIYKKLIWKFPQKKAYFASLIEDLKH